MPLCKCTLTEREREALAAGRCPWALALVRCCIMHRRRMCSDWLFVHAWCMSGIELSIEFGTAVLPLAKRLLRDGGMGRKA